jgi:hypothetical protein
MVGADGEDVAQEAFVRVHRAIGRFDPTGRVVAGAYWRARRGSPPVRDRRGDRGGHEVGKRHRTSDREAAQLAAYSTKPFTGIMNAEARRRLLQRDTTNHVSIVVHWR